MDAPVTVYASIGNSDDRLSQARWAEFHAAFADAIRGYATTVHGSWLSNPADPWQNACIAFDIGPEDIGDCKRELSLLAGRFSQDSIAWAPVAGTEFIGPGDKNAGGMLAGSGPPLGLGVHAPWAPGGLPASFTITGATMNACAPMAPAVTINVHGSVANGESIARIVREQLTRNRSQG